MTPVWLGLGFLVKHFVMFIMHASLSPIAIHCFTSLLSK